MSNMSYCRFENTYGDLEDCYDNMGEEEKKDLSESEKEYRTEIIELCNTIINEYGDELND